MSRFLLYLKRAFWALCVLVVATYGLMLAYGLPRARVLRLTGADVVTTSMGTSGTLSFVRAVDEFDRSLVFRNEDTGWGFPPYFFKKSSEVAGDASRIALSDNPWVELRYYGFRIPLLGAYPNIIGVDQVKRGATPGLPLFNIVFLALHPLLAGFLFWKWRGYKKRRAARAASAATAPEGELPPPAAAPAEGASQTEPRPAAREPSGP